VFKNIRFAAPPVGELRWAKPAPPARVTGVQDGSEGRACTQSGATPRPGIPLTTSGEDCLFLDLTVPAKAIRDATLKLPVMAWFYGGAYGMLPLLLMSIREKLTMLIVVGTKEQR
jgi:carboxylesterase type B